MFFRYYLLELKRGLILMGRSAIMLVMLVTILMGSIFITGHFMNQQQSVKPIRVAFVIPEQEKETKMLIQYISSMDSIEGIAEFIYCEKKDVLSEIQNNYAQAVIEFPEQFFEDAYSGRNTPATVYFPKESTGNARLFEEMVCNGLSMLQTAEAGVYASINTAEVYMTNGKKDQVGDMVAALYAAQYLDRNDAYKTSLVSPFGETNYFQYYAAAAVLAILMMSGISAGFLYRGRTSSFRQKLKQRGIGSFLFSCICILVMTTLNLILYCITTIIIRIAAEILNQPFLLKGSMFAAAVILCMVIAAYFHLVYSLVPHYTQGAVLLLCLNMVLLLCSGIPVPVSYLPEAAAWIGSLLPVETAHQYLILSLEGIFWGKELAVLLMVLVIETALGTFLAWKKR